MGQAHIRRWSECVTQNGRCMKTWRRQAQLWGWSGGRARAGGGMGSALESWGREIVMVGGFVGTRCNATPFPPSPFQIFDLQRHVNLLGRPSTADLY